MRLLKYLVKLKYISNVYITKYEENCNIFYIQIALNPYKHT